MLIYLIITIVITKDKNKLHCVKPRVVALYIKLCVNSANIQKQHNKCLNIQKQHSKCLKCPLMLSVQGLWF